MSEYISDLMSTAYAGGSTGSRAAAKSNDTLDMTDFLALMVAQFQNQSIDNTADTSDMLNQLVQMSVVQAITNITDATVMMYSSSLVGKEVTVAEYTSDGLKEVVGTVTGTGVAGGQQVIFVDGKRYYLSDIMAVGRLPEIEKPNEPEEPGTGQGSGDSEVGTEGQV